ncbi:NUDIX hydrolase [Viridibacillus sp. FSL R5-0477]|uniref:ADP-ribose pyrophosphatase n=1 Tax=Viridibacillus arenosi FSL R5-213 TaxID=1227360 RepID=W4EMH5_9BACL|nr:MULTISPECIES: NUDIX hydrolase [Viridibacillus]ETT81232.1 ADP-ribose pyrophosphatase [Viridibacillus arenosi FSL R5-213]OMC88693.1 ADP-ribose pyrophosphatase [Viridibacillus sp. FSL H7-0596]OMC93326.1 ADP-ribose pyrophosphatase [Viridibacillus arenosi]
MKKFEEKTTSSKKIFEGRVISVKVDEVILPNGNTSTRELVTHPGAVAIIPITNEGKIVLVEQYRKPLERSIIEIPAGKLEKGEKPEYTAIRELEEETGYGSKNFTFVQSFATSPGFADEVIHIYVARDLYRIENPAGLDEDEFVELLEVTLEEAEQMIREERIYDAKTVFAIMWMKNIL